MLISDYERSRLRPHYVMIVRLALALGMCADELLGGGQNSRPGVREIKCFRFRPAFDAVEEGKVGPGRPPEVGQPFGDLSDLAVREPVHLGGFADGHTGPESDVGADHGGVAAAVLLVDVLDDLLAPLVLEIHVDIRRLVPFPGDEALEQQGDLLRGDLGDEQAVAHHRVGSRAPALAQNVAFPREAHDVVDREEVVLIFQLADQFIHRLPHRGDQFFFSTRVHHDVRHTTHQVFAVTNLRVHLPGAGNHFPAGQVTKMRGDRGRPDIERNSE